MNEATASLDASVGRVKRPYRSRDITGVRGGKLVAIRRVGNIGTNSAWLCQCDCGKLVTIRATKLGKDNRSCGCSRVDRPPARTHGRSQTRTYRIWKGMKSRCLNRRFPRYNDYGGRGISICERWAGSFDSFLADMGNAPDNASLDRIDNDGNYEPGNCRWASAQTQCNNRRTNRYFEYNGRRMTVPDLAREAGMRPGLVKDRLKLGWSIHEALTLPVNPQKRPMPRRCKK